MGATLPVSVYDIELFLKITFLNLSMFIEAAHFLELQTINVIVSTHEGYFSFIEIIVSFEKFEAFFMFWRSHFNFFEVNC
jgi:hypothetical protein